MASTDREFLLALCRSAGDGAMLPLWGTDADISEWHGVEVNDEGRVVKLHLANNNLRGILRPTPNSGWNWP